MNKLCPRCRHLTEVQAAFCAACGHQFRTAALMDQTQFALGAQKKRTGNPLRLAWGLPLLILGLLFATNPSRTEFLDWFKDRMLTGPAPTNALTRGLVSGFVVSLTDSGTEQRDLFFGSLYTVRLPGLGPFRVLGIAKRFIPLDPLPAATSPEPAPLVVETTPSLPSAPAGEYVGRQRVNSYQ